MKAPPVQVPFDTKGQPSKEWIDWFLEIFRGSRYQGSGTTAERPTNSLNEGDWYYDTTLGVTVYWSGSAWVDTRDAVLTESYTSSAQTITSAGPLTLAHGLSGKPEKVVLWLKCTTAEYGYAVGDETPVSVSASLGNLGISIVADSTNINIRYGSAANTFYITDHSSGVGVGATNANWNLIVKAWR